MAAVVQQLRTTSATKVPAGLEPGQIAFNLANKWMFVGVGGADILVENTALTTYSSTQTILGKAGIVVPAKPAAGKGYEIYDMHGVEADTWTITDALVNANGGTGLSAKITGALTTKGGGFSAANLRILDMVEVTQAGTAAVAGVPTGFFFWDGAEWSPMGGSVSDATARTGTANIGTGGQKGVVYLARNSDVVETAAPGSTTADPLAVATAAQLKSVVDRFAALVTGQTLLGTYDATAAEIKTVAPAASAGGRATFTVGGKLGAGTGMQPGDYLRIDKAGTVAGETNAATAINTKAFSVGDYIVYDGAEWRALAVPPPPNPTLHGLGDVDDTGLTGALTGLPTVGGSMSAATDGTYVVSPTGGAGTGAALEVVVTGSAPTTWRVVDGGSKYAVGDVLTVPQTAVPGANGPATFTLVAGNLGQAMGLLVRDPSVADGAAGAWKAQAVIDLGTF